MIDHEFLEMTPSKRVENSTWSRHYFYAGLKRINYETNGANVCNSAHLLYAWLMVRFVLFLLLYRLELQPAVRYMYRSKLLQCRPIQMSTKNHKSQILIGNKINAIPEITQEWLKFLKTALKHNPFHSEQHGRTKKLKYARTHLPSPLHCLLFFA